MRKSVLILTECGAEIGFGHLTRCRSIAAVFALNGYQTKLAVQADGVQLEANEQLIRWRERGAAFEEAVCNADIVVVDSYIASETLVGTIQGMNSQTVVVDDYLHRSYTRGVVVDWTVGAEANAYPHRESPTRYLLGTQYCALRPPFWTLSNRAFKAYPERILVTLGGRDIRRLTCPLVRQLAKCFPAVEWHAVFGAGVSSSDERAQLVEVGADVHVSLDAVAMRDLMDAADLAISGGGQTLYELACRGLPAVVVNLIDNQTDDIKGFSARGFATVAGQWCDADLLVRVESAVRDMWGGSQREAASAIGRSLVDGQGAFRLAAEIERTFYTST